MWTLGMAPWWCFPDNELVGVLAQHHQPPRPPEPPEPEPAGVDQPAEDDQAMATIYRWYGNHEGCGDVLLYVGQTGGRQRRPLAHRSKRAAIETERPVWNVTWNR